MRPIASAELSSVRARVCSCRRGKLPNALRRAVISRRSRSRRLRRSSSQRAGARAHLRANKTSERAGHSFLFCDPCAPAKLPLVRSLSHAACTNTTHNKLLIMQMSLPHCPLRSGPAFQSRICEINYACAHRGLKQLSTHVQTSEAIGRQIIPAIPHRILHLFLLLRHLHRHRELHLELFSESSASKDPCQRD